MWLKHIFFWFIATFVLFLLVPLLSSPEVQWGNATKELQMVTSAFGLADATEMATTANNAYETIFVKSGFIAFTRGGYVTENDKQHATMPMGGGLGSTVRTTNGYLDTLAAMVYVVLLRAVMMLNWIPFIFPFLIGVAAEGYMSRKIKFAEFGEFGATVFAGAVHLLVLMLMLPVVYLFLPYPITPLFMPVWILLSAVPMVLAISNANQILPK